MSKKALITGIRGFTGAYLKQELEDHGYQVFGTINQGSAEAGEFIADITKPQDLINVLNEVKPDYIVHLAALSFVPTTDELHIYAVNLFGALNLMNAIRTTGLSPKKILFPSSANIYGNPAENPVTEACPPLPVNHYGISKLAMEFMIRGYFSDYPIVITRPFNYTGIGQEPHFLIPKIVTHYKEKATHITLGNLDIIRDFSSVRFVTHIYRLLLESSAHSDIFNICSGMGVSLMQVIAIMNQLAGYTIEIKTSPSLIRKNEIKSLIGSPEKLRHLFGEIQNISIEDILTEMYHA